MSRELIDFDISHGPRDELEQNIKSQSDIIRTIDEDVKSLKLQLNSFQDKFISIEKYTELEGQVQALKEEVNQQSKLIHDELNEIRMDLAMSVKELRLAHESLSHQTSTDINTIRKDLNDFHSMQIHKYAELDQRILALSDVMHEHIRSTSMKNQGKSSRNIKQAKLKPNLNTTKSVPSNPEQTQDLSNIKSMDVNPIHVEDTMIELSLAPNTELSTDETNPNKIQVKASWLKSFMRMIAEKFSKQNKPIDEIEISTNASPKQTPDLP